MEKKYKRDITKPVRIFFNAEWVQFWDSSLVALSFVSDCYGTFNAQFLDYEKNHITEWEQKNIIDTMVFTSEGKKYIRTNQTWIESNSETPPYSVDIADNKSVISRSLVKWFDQFGEIELWGDHVSQPWVLLKSLIDGHTIEHIMPGGIVQVPFDICTLFKMNGIDPLINRYEFVDHKLGKEFITTREDSTPYSSPSIIKDCYEKLTKEVLESV